MKNNDVLNESEIDVTNGEISVKKPLIITLSTLVTIILFSSMLLFVLLLMFVETAKML